MKGTTKVAGIFLAFIFTAFNAAAFQKFSVKKAKDINPHPNIFETTITASESEITLPNGDTVTVFAYNDQVPGPEIKVKRGDRVIVHLKNELPEGYPTTIHWHGIELNNQSDGTPATQIEVEPGETFTYDFIVPRAGVFWYHPHVRGAQVVNAGLYAPFIVTQPEEHTLKHQGILPWRDISVVLSDIAIANGELKDIDQTPMLETMNGTEGEHLLVNGKVNPTLFASINQGVRLRLINASISRYFRLSLPNHNIYRIGGEGGLIEKVRLEGGPLLGMRMAMSPDYSGNTGMISIDQGYDKGEILLAPAQRADVIIIPKGGIGNNLQVAWKDFARGRHEMEMTPTGMIMTEAEDDGLRPSIDLFKIKILPNFRRSSFEINEGDNLVSKPAKLIEDRTDTQIKLQADMMAMMMGMPKSKWFQIDDFSGINGRTNYRTASVGETLKWETHNHTDMHHPFHLHGFSFQPDMFVKMNHEEGYMDMWMNNMHNEYVDTINIPPHTSAFFLFNIDSRPGYAAPLGAENGNGALGNWVFHCHIFQHGENGMMSFLRVE